MEAEKRYRTVTEGLLLPVSVKMYTIKKVKLLR